MLPGFFRRRAGPAPGSWSIVTTLRGAPATVVPFIAHHLATDAAGIQVYLDDDDPVLIALLAPLPRVSVTVCDDAYWAAAPRRGRPAMIVPRQLANIRHARRRTRTEWLVHIDMDEFLVPDGPGAAPLSAELAALPAGIDWARIRNLERIQSRDRPQRTVFDGFFREQAPTPEIEAEIYGRDRRFFNHGFSGYIRGKIALRVGSALGMGLHNGTFPGQSGPNLPESALPPFRVIEGTRLLHFDGWTALHWTAKLIRHLDHVRAGTGHGGRRQQFEFIRRVTDPARRLGLFDRLQRVTPEREAALRAHGLLRTFDFDPRPAIEAVFPGGGWSFDAADFDAALLRADPDFYARHGLAAAAGAG